jgi:putative flippase GtrA
VFLRTSDLVAVPRFAVMVAVGVFVTSICMRALTGLGLYYLIAQVITSGLAMLLNFRIASRWVFRSARS